MAFELGEDDLQGMSEMNLIPLIDIMLVLMIIFMVTATVLNPSVPLDLPETQAVVNELPAKSIQISIDKDAGIYWDNEPISFEVLEHRLAAEADTKTPPTIRLRADKDSRYDTVAQVLALASSLQLTKIAFVNE